MSFINRRIFAALVIAMSISPMLLAEVQTRIVGGVESVPSARPYFAALMTQSHQFRVGEESFAGNFFVGSKKPLFSGVLVDCASGFSECPGATGKVCLIERGTTFFWEKAISCQNGGGVAAIIYNNISSEPDLRGNIVNADIEVTIPVVGVSQQVGFELLSKIDSVAGNFRSNIIPTSSFCGGVYIGNGWVITAGHCVVDDLAENISVNIGGHDLRVDHDNVIGVEEIRLHPDYRVIQGTSVPVNDFALLKLLKEPDNIQPVAIVTAELLAQAESGGELGTAIGRGIQSIVEDGEDPPFGPPVNTIFEVDMPFVSRDVCSIAYRNILDDSMVCAGTGARGTGTCQGDSGGPIIINREAIDYVAGLTSFGSGCALEGFYDVYSRVPAFLVQINEALELPPPPADPKEDNKPTNPPVTENGDENNGGGAFSLSFFWLLISLRFLRPFLRLKPADTKRYD